MKYRLITPRFKPLSCIYFRSAIIVCALNILAMMQCLLALKRLQYRRTVPSTHTHMETHTHTTHTQHTHKYAHRTHTNTYTQRTHIYIHKHTHTHTHTHIHRDLHWGNDGRSVPGTEGLLLARMRLAISWNMPAIPSNTTGTRI